ncbi:MFS transporter [Dubosiella newyorkensis]|uniref:MFS transporter n=1 Tax=Dubosiella newyorkensis TaxID=1862672 RepID=UPI00258FE427|nr:MFS transporter [Dubosiella newyorkensis]
MSSTTNSSISYESFNSKQRMLLTIGSLGLVFATATYGLSLATIQGPMLKNIGAESAFSLVTLIGSMAMCIMTPIGGRLCDIYGMRKVILVGGIISMISGIGFVFANNLPLFILCRFFLFLAMGSFVTTPYILAGIINKRQDVPKAMGLIAIVLGIGSFLGSYLAGVFTDMNMMVLAILFPIIGLLVGVPLIVMNYPDQEKGASGVHLDVKGTILLVLSLGGILLALNFGPTSGWSNPVVLGCMGVGIVALILLFFVESNAESPLIPLHIFKNKEYSLLLLIAFLSMFYVTGLTTYIPNAIQDIMGQSTTASGSVTIPRTIISIILPGLVGGWVAKNQTRNSWISLSIAGICIAIAFAGLVFIGPHMPLWFVIVMVSLTGIADSFRSVVITPAAQAVLTPKDMGIGTSLIGFFISLSSVISSSLDGIAYDTLRLSEQGVHGITMGVDTVFLISAITGLLTFILSTFIYRKMAENRAKKQAKA